MDFTLNSYRQLINSLQKQDYLFQTFTGFMSNPANHAIILRHDVDKLPGNSLAFARLQHEIGIVGTYYFRAVPESWDEAIIKEIAALDHEVGYHYETMDTAYKKVKGERLKLKG